MSHVKVMTKRGDSFGVWIFVGVTELGHRTNFPLGEVESHFDGSF